MYWQTGYVDYRWSWILGTVGVLALIASLFTETPPASKGVSITTILAATWFGIASKQRMRTAERVWRDCREQGICAFDHPDYKKHQPRGGRGTFFIKKKPHLTM